MTLSEFRKDDYWLVKWPLLSLVLSLCLCGGLLIGLNSIDITAAAELRRARNDLNAARDAVEKIEEEEATIVEYIGRYKQMEQKGVIDDEDRLQFQETIAQLRNEFSLFPLRVSVETQTSVPLKYKQEVRDPGRPIELRTSLVEIGLPLLHEDDLSRLLQALVNGRGMLQPLRCSVSSKNATTTSFIYLSQHFDAACTMQWYTFGLPSDAAGAKQ